MKERNGDRLWLHTENPIGSVCQMSRQLQEMYWKTAEDYISLIVYILVLIHFPPKLPENPHHHSQFRNKSCLASKQASNKTNHFGVLLGLSKRTTYLSLVNLREWRIAGIFCLRFHKWMLSSAKPLTSAPCRKGHTEPQWRTSDMIIHMYCTSILI